MMSKSMKPTTPILLFLSALIAAGTGAPTLAQNSGERDGMGRRVPNGRTTTLAFNKVKVEDLVPFIVESTGKVVIPDATVTNYTITIVNDQQIPLQEALDLVFLALRQARIAVIETERTIILSPLEEVEKQDVPVIGPNETTLTRVDLGGIAEKVYALNNASAETLKTVLEESIPDHARMTVDADSNQVIILGNIAFLQRMERLIGALDRPNAASLSTETFRLRYADAEQIAENIEELFSQDGNSGSSGNNSNSRNNRFQEFFRRRGNDNNDNNSNSSSSSASLSENLRVTANTQQNSVTVLAEEKVLDQIRRQIQNVWDQPLPEDTVVPRIYELQNSDPVKVRDLLEGLFGTASEGGDSQSSQGVGRLAGQFSFQAIPDSGRIVVVAKSPDNLFVIDEIITGLDQPQTAGLPELVELKHASAEELAEQLNALLAQEGTLAQIRRQETGLDESDTAASPFASDNANADNADQASPDTMTFWWQRARVPTDNRGASNLVGRIRLVPVWRQNAVMVMSPPEYRQSVVDLIEELDQPGRQVLISAVIAEISLEDALALGLRWSSDNINPQNSDNAITFDSTTTASEDSILGNLFDTSVLDANIDLNLVLQALDQDTDVNILSEPKIFTSDNQQAVFFDGQDIPFVTDSQPNQNGDLLQSFDYRAVGIQLSVRPRITANRDVDLRVNLELSSIQPQQTLFGGFIVDRRETTTQLIVGNGQTIVISGILRSEESDVKRKVPLLGDIPILGALFTSTERTKSNTELVAFITPHVVDNPDELDLLNNPYRQRLEELREELGAERNAND